MGEKEKSFPSYRLEKGAPGSMRLARGQVAERQCREILQNLQRVLDLPK
jgi:hypothetical protein